MTRRKPIASRVAAARIVRDIMSRYDSLDCNHGKIRALCALLYCVASEEPKESYKYRMEEVRKYDMMEDEEERSNHSIVVDCMSDLVVMALEVLINNISDKGLQYAVKQQERKELNDIQTKGQLLEIERMILTEEEVQLRKMENDKREEKMKEAREIDMGLNTRAKHGKKKDIESRRIKERMILMNDVKRRELEEEHNNEQCNIKSEPVDDEYPGINATQRILNLCEPSTSRVKEEPIDEDEIVQVEPSNFMTRTRARMEKLGRLCGGIDEEGGIVGGTAEIRGIKRVHPTQFDINDKEGPVIRQNTIQFRPPINCSTLFVRQGASLLNKRLERLNNDTQSPTSSPPITIRSILQAQIPSHPFEPSTSLNKRIKSEE